jgi:hypothetical protein
MELKISRVPSDDRLYTIHSPSGTQFGVQPFELKRQLLDLGVGDSTIAAILDLGPDESTTIKVAERAA